MEWILGGFYPGFEFDLKMARVGDAPSNGREN